LINVSVLGATGYAGIELVRLLRAHPEVDEINLVSQNYANKPISEVYPNFKGFLNINCIDMDLSLIAQKSDIVFASLPHGVSADTVKTLRQSGCRVIDLSGDFRYKSAEKYEEWYKIKHPYPEMLNESVYGLPELHREKIRNAKLIANPGCYTTCSILGLSPLAAGKAIELDSIVIDAKSGASGAGRGLSIGLHFCEVNESIKAYGVTTHRHTSEIEQELSALTGQEILLSFTPHLLPVNRGILCTMYAKLNNLYTFEQIHGLYADFYKNEPFVCLYEEGIFPEVKFVNGSNACHIGFAIDKRLNRIIVIAALDNLIKGAGGQAVQNMNILFGFDETLGLSQPGWYL